jgi:hypothetical protein
LEGAISAVGQTINEEEKSWERRANYKKETEIATSLTPGKTRG